MATLFVRAAAKFEKKVMRNVRRQIIFDKNQDYRATTLLAGAGRSGTTWVSQVIINYRNEYRYIFEPFHPKRVPAVSHFKSRQYIRPENRDERFLEPARLIFTGKLRNKWADRFNKRFVCHKRLVKDIRLNLSLRWVYENFTGIPVVLLLRHPCAVAVSEVQQKWQTCLDDIIAQDDLMEDYLSPFAGEIKSARTDFEKHVLLCCVENYVALKQFERGEIHLAFYENFCVNPVDETRRLFTFLGMPHGDASVIDFDKTVSAGGRKKHIDKISLINGWKKHVSDEQLRWTNEILGVFGLNGIYSEDSLPDAQAVHRLMRGSSASPTLAQHIPPAAEADGRSRLSS